MAEMTKWEYKIIPYNNKSFSTELRTLGAEGWELCGIPTVTLGFATNYQDAVFKRPVTCES